MHVHRVHTMHAAHTEDDVGGEAVHAGGHAAAAAGVHVHVRG